MALESGGRMSRRPSRLLLCSFLAACGAGDDGAVTDLGKADGFGAGTLIVNEIAAHPDFDLNGDGRINVGDEYLELVNTGTKALDLSAIQISDRVRVRFQFPDGAVLEGGHAALVVAKVGTFVTPAGSTLFEAGLLGLNDNNDQLTVMRNSTVFANHGYNMSRSERRSWNRTTDADKDSIFTLVEATPGTRADGSNFGESVLTADQTKSILAELHDECPDTFCGGDYSYWFEMPSDNLVCLGNGACTFNLRANPTVDDKFPRNVIEGLSELDLTTVDPGGTFIGRVTGTSVNDTSNNEQDVFVNVECQLFGRYFKSSQLIDDRGEASDDLRDNLVDCLRGDNGIDRDVFDSLPAFLGILTEFESENVLSSLHEECPDTFCGGDFSYFFTNADGALECNFDDGCNLDFAVRPFGTEWMSDPLAGKSAAELTAIHQSGLETATVTGTKLAGNETVVEMRCNIRDSFGFQEAFEIYDAERDSPSDNFRDQFLQCIDAAEGVLSTLPTL